MNKYQLMEIGHLGLEDAQFDELHDLDYEDQKNSPHKRTRKNEFKRETVNRDNLQRTKNHANV